MDGRRHHAHIGHASVAAAQLRWRGHRACRDHRCGARLRGDLGVDRRPWRATRDCGARRLRAGPAEHTPQWQQRSGLFVAAAIRAASWCAVLSGRVGRVAAAGTGAARTRIRHIRMTTRVRWARFHAADRGDISIDLRTCAVTSTATINGQLLARGVLANSPPVGRALGHGTWCRSCGAGRSGRALGRSQSRRR